MNTCKTLHVYTCMHVPLSRLQGCRAAGGGTPSGLPEPPAAPAASAPELVLMRKKHSLREVLSVRRTQQLASYDMGSAQC